MLGKFWRLKIKEAGLDGLPEAAEILLNLLLARKLLAHRVVVEDLLLVAALPRRNDLPDPASGNFLKLSPLRVRRQVKRHLAVGIVDHHRWHRRRRGRHRSELVDKVEYVI